MAKELEQPLVRAHPGCQSFEGKEHRTLGEISDGLERALRTRPLPGSVNARLGFLLRLEKGSTRRLAEVLGVSQRTVQRWVTSGSGRRPPGAVTSAGVVYRRSLAGLVLDVMR